MNNRKFILKRQELVELLQQKGITHQRVLEAIGQVPRHLFVEPALRHRAYQNEALPIGLKQTISQPYTVAYQTSLLDPAPGARILEIGTGSGYQAAILCAMGAQVYTIERHTELLARARQVLDQLHYRVISRIGDGSIGWPTFAPFEGILVTAGASTIPEPLIEQLAVGGRLVIPVGNEKTQRMVRITRKSAEEIIQETFDNFRFVPLITSFT